jgi:phosphoribosylformylglycinamidine cyclo-ligase
MRSSVARTTRPEVVGGLGGFAGLFALDTSRYRRPLLASSTDGVGTKLVIAQALDRHDTIGIDLIAMVVDDLVVVGAEPLFLTDYIATGKVIPERIAQIVSGIAEGCVQAGCSLVGGETAEHPGLMGADEYDVSATGIGVVEADDVLGPERVRAGDVLVALGSSGLHSNGYSLARHVLLPRGEPIRDLLAAAPALLGGRTLGEEMLVPTRIYALDVLALAATGAAHAFAHITGGGLAGNLVRVLPSDVDARVDRSSWAPMPIFDLIGGTGSVPLKEMERTFNLGVGMIAVLAPERVEESLQLLTARGVGAWVIGDVVAGTGNVEMSGAYRGAPDWGRTSD